MKNGWLLVFGVWLGTAVSEVLVRERVQFSLGRGGGFGPRKGQRSDARPAEGAEVRCLAHRFGQ